MAFSKEEIKKGLADFDTEAVELFSTYCTRLLLEKDKDGKVKNDWIQNWKADKLTNFFKQVAKDGLFILMFKCQYC